MAKKEEKRRAIKAPPAPRPVAERLAIVDTHLVLSLGGHWGWCACGQRCPVNLSPLGGNRPCGKPLCLRFVSLRFFWPSGPRLEPLLRRTSLRNGLVSPRSF